MTFQEFLAIKQAQAIVEHLETLSEAEAIELLEQFDADSIELIEAVIEQQLDEGSGGQARLQRKMKSKKYRDENMPKGEEKPKGIVAKVKGLFSKKPETAMTLAKRLEMKQGEGAERAGGDLIAARKDSKRIKQLMKDRAADEAASDAAYKADRVARGLPPEETYPESTPAELKANMINKARRDRETMQTARRELQITGKLSPRMSDEVQKARFRSPEVTQGRVPHKFLTNAEYRRGPVDRLPQRKVEPGGEGYRTGLFGTGIGKKLGFGKVRRDMRGSQIPGIDYRNDPGNESLRQQLADDKERREREQYARKNK